MARIRSIKPEFWRDAKIASLSKGCALFFIGLWNFCDDEGKVSSNSFGLSLSMPLFRSQEIQKYLSALVRAGLVRSSRDREWVLVEHWEHQKIDKPKLPRIRKEEIEWNQLFTEDYSTNDQRTVDDHSTTIRRKDRIGSDRKGEDRIGKDNSTSGVQAPPGKQQNLSEPISRKTWESYCTAYEERYGSKPVRNATVNSQLANFVKRIGEEESPLVAAYYLTHTDQFYMRNMHSVGFMLRDAEKLRTEWATGRKVVGNQSRTMEREARAMDQLQRIAEGKL